MNNRAGRQWKETMEDLHDHWREKNEPAVLENVRNWLNSYRSMREGCTASAETDKVKYTPSGFKIETKERKEEWFSGCCCCSDAQGHILGLEWWLRKW